MKKFKKQTLAIVAALAVPAASHADVTIYGIMGAGIESASATGNGTSKKEYKTTTRVVDENSRIGFAGNEDLGNGLKSIWQIETSLRNFEQGGTNDKGQTASLATRNTFVGLEDSRWGTLQLGLYDTAYKRLTGVGLNILTNTVGEMNTGGAVVYDRRVTRLANSVHYTTPTWHGLQAGVSYGVDEARPTASNGTRQDDNRFDAAVAYSNAGLQLAAGYDYEGDKLNSTATADGQQHVKAYKLAASYTFARTGTLIGAGFERIHISNNVSADTNQNDYLVALQQPLGGAWTLKAGYAALGKLDGASNPDDYKATQWLAGVSYDLSKHTQLLVYGSKIHNHREQDANFGVNPIYTSAIGTSSATLDKGNDPQAFGVGMSMTF